MPSLSSPSYEVPNSTQLTEAYIDVTVLAAIDDTLTIGAELSSDLVSFNPATRNILAENAPYRIIRFSSRRA